MMEDDKPSPGGGYDPIEFRTDGSLSNFSEEDDRRSRCRDGFFSVTSFNCSVFWYSQPTTEESYISLHMSPLHEKRNFQTFLHLVKCSFGIGVLAFPYGFKNAGMYLGFILGVIVSVGCIYCFHVLFRTMQLIAAEVKQPYVNVNEAVKYSFKNSHKCCIPMSTYSRVIIDTLLATCYFGICTAYVNYLTVTSLALSETYKESAEGPINVVRSIVSLMWVIPLYMINCLRDLKTLAPVSLLGNVTTMMSMLLIFYAILDPTESFSNTWKPYGTIHTTPLFIGTILFAVEAFGVVVAVEKDVKKPRSFLGYFGVLNIAYTFVVTWYLFIGAAGYLKYGENVKSTIVHTITKPVWLGSAVQIIMALAIFCSYPLQCYVVIDIVWYNWLEEKITKATIFWEYIFRFVVTLGSGIVSLLAPRLDLIVSLVGAVCLTMLGIVLPAVLEYCYIVGRQGWKKPLVLIKDIIIMIGGLVAFGIGVYSPLYNIAVVDDTGVTTTTEME